MTTTTKDGLLERIERLNSIGIALSAEKDPQRLLERILVEAKTITRADGGTLYVVTDDGRLKMEIVRTDSLGIALGGTTGAEVPFPPIPLYDDHGNPLGHMVVTYAVHHDCTVNIADAYATDEFDFSGTRKFDGTTGYRSRSFLTVPLKDHENDIIGVLQLINALEPDSGEVVAFGTEDQRLVESLASQAAIALTNRKLIEDLKALFDALVKLIATAIDEKSPYTAGHCSRLPPLTMMIAEAAARTETGPLREFRLGDEDRYELEVAAWLHDCGKITTPEYVMDKATKLETIFDRIHLVDTRFEVLKRDAEIELLQAQMEALKRNDPNALPELEAAYRRRLAELDDDRAFLRKCNIGSEFMSGEDQARVTRLAARTWRNADGELAPFLSEDEQRNLNIPKGTLNPEERTAINHHIVATIKMLEKLPFPKHLRNVPEYAGGHHERMDGRGYPNGLTREQMSIPARIMGIADIFEALTASDRPYKKAMTLSTALRILGNMKLDGHIDPDLFDVFMREKVYLEYARRFLPPSQIDDVIPEKIPGYPGN